jgi:hypothetical protein
MKANLLLALSLFCVPVAEAIEEGLWFLNNPSQWPHMDGYIELKNGKVNLEFNGETARELYTWFPGSSIIRPDKVCSRGLKTPPTVKRTGGVLCERHASGQAATYKCFARMDITAGRLVTLTEEYICGLNKEKLTKPPEEEEEDFQKILSGAPPVGYPLLQLNEMIGSEKTPINGNIQANGSWSTEFFFSGETARMLYEAMPKNLILQKAKACVRGTVKRSDGLLCVRAPSADKKPAIHTCYARLEPNIGWLYTVTERFLCEGDGDGDA